MVGRPSVPKAREPPVSSGPIQYPYQHRRRLSEETTAARARIVGEVGVPVGAPAGGGMAEYGGPRSRTRDRAASRNSIPRACPGALAGDPGIADANVSV